MGGSLNENCIAFIFSKLELNRDLYNIFVETGTYMGNTIINMSNHFNRCYTIELSEHYYNLSKKRASRINNITFLCGDSTELLKQIHKEETNPIIYYLDAHYSSENTARSKKDVPLLEELDTIIDRDQKDIVIIDDYRLFGTNNNEDWSNITIESINERVKQRDVISFIHNDRYILYFK